MENLGVDDLTAFPPNSDWPTGHLFAAAARLSMPVAWRIIGQHGISPVGFYLLRLLIVDDGLRPGEAAKRLVVTPATITSVVDTLERNGHVRRERSYRDRRGVMLRITDSGRRLLAEKSQPISRELARLYDVVDEGDEEAVRRFLINLIERFENHSHEEEAEGDRA
ncbi:MarR family winged helix-turn-helix transcriptional regulator [Actinomadura sp. BRA 177]|uniref:MarR family winged helix-turn-helix transcriptional regulator n=1 Tax=Actinomadura sp. BRA 177 TaxID=2745202 RepID=UPI001595D24F|nr:MarR family winged helix-turn-helix transcriptional regulator [Actinomadura sp. BRA 177]NVI88955.1 winged helix-turn-helix transcriptional regulator [Actinomadura sp. BRA 177]